MKNINITCPHCTTEFNAAEQLEQHFQQIELKDKLLNEKENKIIQLEKSKKDNNQEIGELMKQLKNAKLIVKQELKKEYDESVKNAFQKGFESKELNIKVLKKEAKEAAKEEMKMDIEKASEAAFQKGILVAEQKLQDEKEKEVTKLKTQLTAERLDKERLNKHIEELREKSNQRNVELQGEAQEIYLEDMLKSKFPNDKIEDIKKGANGHDCTLTINHKGTDGLAKIAFESKNTKNFSNEWVDKLHKTLMERKIPYGVITTNALPKDFKHIEWRYQSIIIIPFRESSVIATAQLLKALLIREIEVRKAGLLDESAKGQLYERLLSPQMRMHVTSLMRSMLEAQNIIEDDERISAKSIVKRQANVNEQRSRLLKVFRNISGADSDLADNLIFTDEEIIQSEKISHIKSLKGPKKI